MKNRLFALSSTLGLLVVLLGACTNPNLVSADRNNIIYAAGVDQTMDAIEDVMTVMRWSIIDVDSSISGRIMMEGVQLQTRDTGMGSNPSSYRFFLTVISVGRNTTQVRLDIQDGNYGASRAQQTRRTFFNHMERQGLVPAASE